MRRWIWPVLLCSGVVVLCVTGLFDVMEKVKTLSKPIPPLFYFAPTGNIARVRPIKKEGQVVVDVMWAVRPSQTDIADLETFVIASMNGNAEKQGSIFEPDKVKHRALIERLSGNITPEEEQRILTEYAKKKPY